jgi:hypothetical protein
LVDLLPLAVVPKAVAPLDSQAPHETSPFFFLSSAKSRCSCSMRCFSLLAVL